MAEKKFSELTAAAILGNDDIFALSQMDSGSLASKKTTLTAIANHINTVVQYTNAYGTQAKTTAGAINELKQLISLIPQFSIEVVEELPTEDISDTTIYLVPAEDPEVGNYYEEYIHVNNTWELVGTTAVDLSAYYTKLEVDGLLADKLEADDFEASQTASANPITLETKQAGLAKSCVVEMNPIQDLSHGEPSPTNICPISGRTQAEVANMCDGSENMITTPVTVNAPANVETYPEIAQISVEQGKTYYISCMQENDLVSITRNTIRLATPQGNIYESINSNYHLQKGVHYIIYKAPATQNISIYMWCHTPNTAVTYDNFICTLAQNIIQFGQTVYGGTLDVTSGKLTIDKGFITYDGTENWQLVSGTNRFYYNSLPSNIDKSSAISNSRVYRDSPSDIGGYFYFGGSSVLFNRTVADQTADQFKAELVATPVQVCYLLATAIIIQLSPEAVTLLKGQNVISTDGDSLEMKYSVSLDSLLS